jgi:4-nitrophenyl phosphatase
VRALALDLDGTVYRGREPVAGAVEAVHRFLAAGWPVRFVTNNSAANRAEVALRLQGWGIPCDPSWVMGSGPLAARHCLMRGHKRVACLGEPGLVAALTSAGLQVTLNNPSAIVVGIARHATYSDIAAAADLARGGAEFVATNLDATYPLEDGRLAPGAGALVAAVEVASGQRPRVLGKPETALIEWALEDLGIGPEELLVVGDRLDTDIECGRRAGCPTWLVLTGVESSVPAGQPGGATLLELANDVLGR